MNVRSNLITTIFYLFITDVCTCQKVDFNHFYTVLPVSVLTVINDNKFLKDTFFSFDQRTTTAGDGSSWTGSYFYTGENYFELFDEESYKASAGYSGIAFYLENKGELATLKAKTKVGFMDTIVMKSKVIDGKNIPWFLHSGIGDTVFLNKSSIYSWVMAYDKKYFDNYHLPYTNDQLTVKNYVTDHLDNVRPRLAQKITGLDLALSEADSIFYDKYLKTMGFIHNGKIQKVYENENGFKIKISRIKNRKSVIRKIHLRLNKKHPFRKVVVCNAVRVVLNNENATLELNY